MTSTVSLAHDVDVDKLERRKAELEAALAENGRAIETCDMSRLAYYERRGIRIEDQLWQVTDELEAAEAAQWQQ